ncbi:hypothetical protein BGX23_003975 [Mortierella sp. AD031]|nr:hypothetical protein BGX23_003975 [Mortierella sp. AD031]
MFGHCPNVEEVKLPSIYCKPSERNQDPSEQSQDAVTTMIGFQPWFLESMDGVLFKVAAALPTQVLEVFECMDSEYGLDVMEGRMDRFGLLQRVHGKVVQTILAECGVLEVLHVDWMEAADDENPTETTQETRGTFLHLADAAAIPWASVTITELHLTIGIPELCRIDRSKP